MNDGWRNMHQIVSPDVYRVFFHVMVFKSPNKEYVHYNLLFKNPIKSSTNFNQIIRGPKRTILILKSLKEKVCKEMLGKMTLSRISTE